MVAAAPELDPKYTTAVVDDGAAHGRGVGGLSATSR